MRIVTFAAALAAAGAAAGDASAASSPRWGGDGGTAYTMACPDGEKISGIGVRAGHAVDAVGLACDRPNRAVNAYTGHHGRAGGQGGAGYQHILDQRWFLRGVRVSFCKHKGVEVVKSLRFLSYDPTRPGAKKESQTYGPRCDSRHGPTEVFYAPQGHHIYGFYGRAGRLVDSFGVLTRPLPAGVTPTRRIDGQRLAAGLNATVFRDASLRLDNLGSYGPGGGFREDGARVRIGPFVERFSIDPVSARRNRGLYRVDFYVNDLETEAVDLTVDRRVATDMFTLTLDFEQEGREVKGFCRRKRANGAYTVCPDGGDAWIPDANLVNPRVRVTVVPELFNGRCGGRQVNSITLTTTGAEFEGRVRLAGDIKGVPNVVEDWLRSRIDTLIEDKMVSAIRGRSQAAVQAALNGDAVQCRIATLIRDEVLDRMGVGQVRTVGMRDGDVLIGL